jgi:hypothetical protein
MDHGKSDETDNTRTTDGNEKGGDKTKPAKPLTIQDAQEYYPDGKPQHAGDADLTYDKDSSTYWRTYSYRGGPKLAPFKQGVGIVYDLGSAQDVSAASIGLYYTGDHTTATLYAADSLSSSASLGSMTKIASGTTSGKDLKISAKKAVKTRYVLVWITAVPNASGDQFSGAGYKQAITDVKFTG